MFGGESVKANKKFWWERMIDYITWQIFRKNKDHFIKEIVSKIPSFITPDLLVYLRIFLTLIIILLFFNKVSVIFNWLLLIYLICKIFDFFDGSLARYRGQTTFFGEIFDPLSDRLLNLIALVIIISLWHFNSLWLYFFVSFFVMIMIYLDLFFSLFNLFSFRLVYFRKIFETTGLLITVILLITELTK